MWSRSGTPVSIGQLTRDISAHNNEKVRGKLGYRTLANGELEPGKPKLASKRKLLSLSKKTTTKKDSGIARVNQDHLLRHVQSYLGEHGACRH